MEKEMWRQLKEAKRPKAVGTDAWCKAWQPFLRGLAAAAKRADESGAKGLCLVAVEGGGRARTQAWPCGVELA